MNISKNEYSFPYEYCVHFSNVFYIYTRASFSDFVDWLLRGGAKVCVKWKKKEISFTPILYFLFLSVCMCNNNTNWILLHCFSFSFCFYTFHLVVVINFAPELFMTILYYELMMRDVTVFISIFVFFFKLIPSQVASLIFFSLESVITYASSHNKWNIEK